MFFKYVVVGMIASVSFQIGTVIVFVYNFNLVFIKFYDELDAFHDTKELRDLIIKIEIAS